MRSSTSSLTDDQCRRAAAAPQRDARREAAVADAAACARLRAVAVLVDQPQVVVARSTVVPPGVGPDRWRSCTSSPTAVGIPRRGFQGDHYDVPEEHRDRGGGGGGRGGRQSRAGSAAARRRPAAESGAAQRPAHARLIARQSWTMQSWPTRWLGEQVAWTPGDVVAEDEPVDELAAVCLGDLAQLEPAIGVAWQGAVAGTDRRRRRMQPGGRPRPRLRRAARGPRSTRVR